MNTNRFKIVALAAALIATTGLSVGLTGCDAAGPSDASGAPTATALDGETLFRAVMLGDGEMATRLPEVHGTADARARLSLEEVAERAALNHYIVQTVRTEAPDFFDAFAAAVTSGRPDRADAAMQQGAEHIVAALTDHPDADVRNAVTQARTQASVVGETEDACLVAVAVAVVVVVAAWAWVYLPEREVIASAKADGSQLHREQAAAWVAERFAAGPTVALR